MQWEAIVVFANGQPDKESYRHFRIEGKAEPDDPAMMAEVVERFVQDEPEMASNLDLLVLDGGKGQLNRVHHLLKEMEMSPQPTTDCACKRARGGQRPQGAGAL